MKLLVSAFACHPGMGSEDGVGWGWVTGLAAHHEVHVITRDYRRADIEAARAERPVAKLTFHYTDPPPWMIFWKTGSRNFMIYALLWQFFALALALRLSARQRFDIVQHLTYGNLWLPSFLFLVPGTYVLGPVGGGVVPEAFSADYRLRERLVEAVRFLVQRYLRWVNLPMLCNMFRARLILARTEETLALLPGWARRKATLVPETALDLARFPYDPQQRRDLCRSATLVLVYAGRILSLKNLHLAVTGFRELLRRYPQLAGRIRFDIYGEGPYLPVCRQLAGEEESIVFHGFLERDLLMERLRQAHLFVHLSVKDTAATAPMEAMALGLPVICVNSGGMGNLVDDACGVLLEPSHPGQIVESLVEVLRELAEDRERLLQLALAARQKIERSFSWERRIEQYNEILKRELPLLL